MSHTLSAPVRLQTPDHRWIEHRWSKHNTSQPHRPAPLDSAARKTIVFISIFGAQVNHLALAGLFERLAVVARLFFAAQG